MESAVTGENASEKTLTLTTAIALKLRLTANAEADLSRTTRFPRTLPATSVTARHSTHIGNQNYSLPT